MLARRALDAARAHSHKIARAYAEALDTAAARQQCQDGAGARQRYMQAAVIVRDEHVAALREQLDAATVAVNEADAEYRRQCQFALLRPRRRNNK